jgi:outer membrane protein OmpA-like peptidoglycan-associated protein
MTYGVGAGLGLRGLPAAALLELAGEIGGDRPPENPLELRAGARVELGPIVAQAGYGRGLVHGYGAPDHRVLLGVAFRPQAPPPPPPPVVAVRPPAPPPRDPDPDRDGILDDADRCPTDAEDVDGFEDQDGCPEADNDQDLVLDDVDACRNHAEDRDAFADSDGCPDPDNDADGLFDGQDGCPIEAEVINGVDDDDGCPDEGRQLVFVGATKIEIREKLFFANNKDVILPRSEPVLAQMATTLSRMAWLKKIRIEGHTDARGEPDPNLDLSRRRAASVRRALIERGIDEARLESEGYGEAQPIDSNATVEGRANNRRVEFVILEQEPAPNAPSAPAAPAAPSTPPPGAPAPGGAP